MLFIQKASFLSNTPGVALPGGTDLQFPQKNGAGLESYAHFFKVPSRDGGEVPGSRP